jgi:hypothetical protein
VIGFTTLFAPVVLTVVARLLRPSGAKVERTGHFGFDRMDIARVLLLSSPSSSPASTPDSTAPPKGSRSARSH